MDSHGLGSWLVLGGKAGYAITAMDGHAALVKERNNCQEGIHTGIAYLEDVNYSPFQSLEVKALFIKVKKIYRWLEVMVYSDY